MRKEFANSMMNSKVVFGVVFMIMRLSFISSLSQILNNSLSEDDLTLKNNENMTTLSTQLFSLSSSVISSSTPTTMTTSISSEEIKEILSKTMTNTTIMPDSTQSYVESVTKPVQNIPTTNNLITITLSALNSSIDSVSINDKTTPSITKLISTSTIVDFKVPENCSDYKVSQMQRL